MLELRHLYVYKNVTLLSTPHLHATVFLDMDFVMPFLYKHIHIQFLFAKHIAV